MPLPSIQQQAPAFTGEALFPDKVCFFLALSINSFLVTILNQLQEIKDISLSDYLGKWVVFFWYPLDFTFVCPTEIIAFGDRQPEFTAINTQVQYCFLHAFFSPC